MSSSKFFTVTVGSLTQSLFFTAAFGIMCTKKIICCLAKDKVIKCKINASF